MLRPLTFLWVFAILAKITANDESRPLVICQTTKGPIKIEIYSEWAPLGAQRFLELVKDNFYTNIALFRCVKRFLVQFGISEDPSKKHWHNKNIPDDPNLNLGIKKHYLSYAGGGPNTRSTQLFIAFEDLDFLGHEPWETPFGKVIEGGDTLDALYKGYGDIPPFGKGPNQGKIHNQGNAYIKREFPLIDFINSCELIETSEEAYLKDKMDHHELQSLIPVAGDDKESFVPQEASNAEVEEPKKEDSSHERMNEPVIVIVNEKTGSLRERQYREYEAAAKKYVPSDEKSLALVLRALGLLSVFIIFSCIYMFYIKPQASSTSKQL